MNKILLTGNLTKDIELKVAEGGTNIVSCSIAVKGYNKDDVDFINLKAFGKTAEFMSNYLKKGSKIGVEGRLSVRSYEKNNEKRTFTEVIVDRVEFLDKKQKQDDTISESDIPF